MISSIFLIFLGLHFVLGCPENPLPPCTCRTIGFHSSIITCSNVNNEVELQKSLYSMGNTTIPVNTVEIFDSTLNYIPNDLFQGFCFPKLHIAGTSLTSLSDTDVAFAGLENCLESFFIQECTLYAGWDWSILRNLNYLTELKTIKVGPLDVDESIKEIDHLNLKKILFTQDSISYVHPQAFRTFRNLNVLSLKYNNIKVVQRSMFPMPANEFEMIILSHNQIEYLPPDLFIEMPNMKTIIVGDNHIVSLNSQTLKPVWSQLKKIDVTGNPLRCDCRMNWLLSTKFPLNTWGECEEPMNLKGKKLTELHENDLWC